MPLEHVSSGPRGDDSRGTASAELALTDTMTRSKKKPFDRDAWAAERDEKLAQARNALTDGIRALVTGDDWAQMLNGLAILGPTSISRLSFRNMLLVLQQRPTARYAATFKGWQELGRHVRKGEKGLMILQPCFSRSTEEQDEKQEDGEDSRRFRGFRPLYLFGLDQTDGPDLPTVTPSDVTGPEAFPASVEQLRAVALALPGAPVADITLRARRADLGDPAGARGWYNRSTREIVVITEERERPAIFRTLVHEVAHSLLHGADDHHSRPEQEVEAESVAYVVCHALGLDSSGYSFPYVASWAGGEDAVKAVEASGARISRAARTLLDALCPSPAASDADELPGVLAA